jgi:2-polyprenyl-3-methyl-5-hydroxy-6-metoxy-1,4-benzoquinol methylase
MHSNDETLERITPEKINPEDMFAQRALQLHLQRYEFALQNLAIGNVLDIACGTGYGTALLAKTNQRSTITGVDIDVEAISYAKKKHTASNITFIQNSLLEFTSPILFTTIVSLETIEHIAAPEKVVSHLLNLLTVGGRLIISAPVTPSMDGNPYHVNDFTIRSFKALFSHSSLITTNELLQIQPYRLKDVVGPKKINRLKSKKRSLLLFYFRHPLKLFSRLLSLATDGFNNKYLTLVIEKY